MKNNELISKFFQFLEKKKGTQTPFEFKILNQDKFNFTNEELNVETGLWLSGTNITSLPKNLKVILDLDLSNTKITYLPKGLKVGGDLSLRNTSVKSLPNDLKVGNSIIVNNDKLTSFKSKYPQYNFSS